MESRTVFDTNNWISYFIGKKTGELLKMTEKNVVFLHSTASANELLGDKAVLSTPVASEILKVTTLPAFKEYLQFYI